jgi:hypothetical protein
LTWKPKNRLCAIIQMTTLHTVSVDSGTVGGLMLNSAIRHNFAARADADPIPFTTEAAARGKGSQICLQQQKCRIDMEAQEQALRNHPDDDFTYGVGRHERVELRLDGFDIADECQGSPIIKTSVHVRACWEARPWPNDPLGQGPGVLRLLEMVGNIRQRPQVQLGSPRQSRRFSMSVSSCAWTDSTLQTNVRAAL